MATAKTFQPDLFIVDKEPLGLKGEVLPTLEWLKKESPQTNVVLGLRDILDEAEVIKKDWDKKGIYNSIDSLYNEIWVYGDKDIYNPIREYNLPCCLNERTLFTGYIPRNAITCATRKKTRRNYRILDDDQLLLVTAGGGGDGSEMLDHYIAMHEYFPTSLPFKSIIITGPFMPKEERVLLRARAKQYGIKVIPFHAQLEDLIHASDLVISMGGYNTICEILTQQTPALIIPRETPRKEQLIRAQHLKRRGLLDYIAWTEVTPQLLREKIVLLLNKSDEYTETIKAFKLTGLDVMRARLDTLKQQRKVKPSQTESNNSSKMVAL